MSRLKIATANVAGQTVESLYKDLERMIVASPPGICPVDLALNFLRLCHAQTCGKCVPCRVGLGQLANLISDVLDGKADMTVGSRFVGEGNTFKSTVARRAGITILSALIKLITGQRIYDVTSGFRAVNQDVLREFVQYYPHDYPEPESLSCMISLGKRVQEVGVVMHERQGGTSSIGAKSALYYMLKVGLAIVVRPYGSKER